MNLFRKGMNYRRRILITAILLGGGSAAGWFLRPLVEGSPPVALPEYGGTFYVGFRAEVTWHPETGIKGSNFALYDTTWRWEFHNRSDKPIQFSIPNQRFIILHGIDGRQFVELPDSLLVVPPISLAPGEKREFTSPIGMSLWHRAKDLEDGFEIVAKVDDKFQILGCAATVKKATKAEQTGTGQPATMPADKAPVKDQPSPPTPKDGPR